MNEWLVQGIGFVGVFLFVVSYQIKSNRALFLCQLAGCLVFCVQFLILGAYTGALGLLISVLRNVLLLLAKKRSWAGSRYTLYGLLLLLAAVTAYKWAGWPSLLYSLAVGIRTVGFWTRNGQKIRASHLFGTPCALAYNIIIRSWGGVVTETITLLSILISICRFGWKNLGKEVS